MPVFQEATLHQQYLDSFPNLYYPTPIRGIKTDVPETELQPFERYVPFCLNFLPTDRATLRKREGYFKHLENREITDFFEWADETGDPRVICIEKTASNMVRLLDLTQDTTTGALIERPSSELSARQVVNPGAFPHFSIYGGSGNTVLYIAIKGNPLLKYDPNHATVSERFTKITLSDGLVTDIKADIVLHSGGHLLIANTEETTAADGTIKYPYRLRVSKFIQPEDFATTGDVKGFRTDVVEDKANSPIMAIEPLREAFVIYKRSSIHNLSNRGDGIFYHEMKCSDRGAVSGKAMAPVYDGNVHLVVSQDNIYLYDGFTLKFPPVGDPVRPFLFGKKGRLKGNESSVVVKSFPDRYECWIFFEDNTDDTRKALCWNWQRRSWTFHDLAIKTAIHAPNTFRIPINSNLASTEDDGDISFLANIDDDVCSLFRGTKDARSGTEPGDSIEASIRFPLQPGASKNQTGKPPFPPIPLDKTSGLEASLGDDYNYKMRGLLSNSMIQDPIMVPDAMEDAVTGEEDSGRTEFHGLILFKGERGDGESGFVDVGGEALQTSGGRYAGAIITCDGDELEEIGDFYLKGGK